jgi:hypothetical protein
MSYDLFLKPKVGEFTKEHFVSYFGSRSNYTLEESQAWYQNESTGVYFVFDFQEEEQDEEAHFPVAFNMNYFRPTFFANEAEPEVKEFITRFDLVVYDPQTNGMGSGDFDAEKFRSGWLHGNEFGYQAILKDHPDVFSLPTQKLEDVWYWNINKDSLQEKMEYDVFVPSIMVLKHENKVLTACVWPDAIPSVIPPVDILLIGRKELAPRKLFRKIEDMAISTWDAVEPLLNKHKKEMQGSAYCLFYYDVPTEIKAYIKQLKNIEVSSLERLSVDQVLNAELVEKFSA